MNTGLRTRADQRWLVILALIAAIYCAVNLLLPRLSVSGSIASYVIEPALWCVVIWAILKKLPPYRVAGRLKTKSAIIWLALMIGIVQVALYAIGGFLSGFGKSPSSLSPLGILTNLVLVGSMLAGMELSRAWLINHLGKHVLLGIAFLTVVYTLVSLPLAQVLGLKLEVASLDIWNSTLLPSLAQNLLACLLALLAGPLASLAYVGVLEAFWWFCPVLPDLSWSVRGLVGVGAPLIGLALAWGFYVSHTRQGGARRSTGGLQAHWIAVAVLSVSIVWFAVGAFPIRPVLVGSGSMSPKIEVADVVIVAKSSASSIKVGDVIEFRTPKENIMHRVVAIQGTGETEVFITKGDANDAPDDDPVMAGNVVGKAIFRVPKLGWLAAAIKKLFMG